MGMHSHSGNAMRNHHGHGGALGIFAIVAAIAFAFGERTARIIVGSALLIGAAFFAHIIISVWMGMI
jgi:hypothetical protein